MQSFFSISIHPFLTGVQELCSMWNEEKCSMADACWPQALGGLLLALSSEGDIIYLTENVTQQLGLPQVRISSTEKHTDLSLNLICFFPLATDGPDWAKHLRLLPPVRSR